MAKSCFCGGGLSNLGLFSCNTIAKVTKKNIFMNKYGSDGSRNGIPKQTASNTGTEGEADKVWNSSGQLLESYILTKLDATDYRDRWYITPGLYEEINPSRTDKVQETAASGTTRTLQNGVIQFEARNWDTPQAWSANLNQASCNEMATYTVDKDGTLVGESSEDKEWFYPLSIEKDTLNAEYFDPTDTTGQYTMVTYQLDKVADEGRFIPLSSGQISVNLLTALSLIDIVLTEGGTTTATDLFVLAESDIYGTFNNYEALVGATTATDWTVLDGVTPVVVSTAAEDQSADDYNYQLTIPSTPATALTVSYKKTRTSVDEFGFIASAITITTP